jgi:hypothetical protein
LLEEPFLPTCLTITISNTASRITEATAAICTKLSRLLWHRPQVRDQTMELQHVIASTQTRCLRTMETASATVGHLAPQHQQAATGLSTHRYRSTSNLCLRNTTNSTVVAQALVNACSSRKSMCRSRQTMDRRQT